MKQTVDFIKDRAVRTISAAKSLAPDWVWKKKTADQMQSDLWAITGNSTISPPIVGQEEIAATAKRVRGLAMGTWDTQMEELHRRTVQAVGMIKTELADDPALFAVVSGLSASSNSRNETLSEALALESAWTKAAPTWNPTTTNTLTAFSDLRKDCDEDLKQAFSDAHVDWRKQVAVLNAMANAVEQSDEAWYSDATKVFAAGTPQGDTVRSTIPTTYTPNTKTPPAPAPTPAGTKTP